MERIIWGLFKAMVLAGLASWVHDRMIEILGNAGELGWFRATVALAVLTASYPVYLYLNFSGYTDFVIGIARFFRRELPENFNWPFYAASFIEYWDRWHMSLSGWLKAYVYTPLMLNISRRLPRPGLLPFASAGPLFITFFLIGVWHGRTANFLIFGLLNGFGVMANQLYRVYFDKYFGASSSALKARPFYNTAARGLTYLWVSFTLLWFWSNPEQLSGFAAKVGAAGLATAALLLFLMSALTLHFVLSLAQCGKSTRVNWAGITHSRHLRIAIATMLGTIVAVVVSTSGSTPDIVYEKF